MKLKQSIGLAAVCLSVLNSCVVDNRTPEEKLADAFIEQAKDLQPKIQAIEELIDSLGKPADFPSDSALSSRSPFISIFGTPDKYNRVLKMLDKDMKAYERRKAESADEPSMVGLCNTLFYFCNDTLQPVRTGKLEILDTETRPLAILSDRELLVNYFKQDSLSLYHTFQQDKIQELIDCLKDVENIVFIKYDCAMFPSLWMYNMTKGAIRANAKVYRVEDKSLLHSVKVFAESSDSLQVFSLPSQRALDNDIEYNLGMELVRTLTEQGMCGIERETEAEE